MPTVCVCAFIMGTHHALKETEMNDRIKKTCRALYTDRVAYYDRIGKGKKKTCRFASSVHCSVNTEHSNCNDDDDDDDEGGKLRKSQKT